MDLATVAVLLVDRNEGISIRDAEKIVDVPRATVQDRRRSVQPRGQEEIKHARLSRYQEKVLLAYIRDFQLQYAPINYT